MADPKPITVSEKEHAAWSEVRPHPDGTLDELVIDGGASVHLEQMDTGLWWLAVYKNGERQVVWFQSKSPIHAWTERDQ